MYTIFEYCDWSQWSKQHLFSKATYDISKLCFLSANILFCTDPSYFCICIGVWLPNTSLFYIQNENENGVLGKGIVAIKHNLLNDANYEKRETKAKKLQKVAFYGRLTKQAFNIDQNI